ncbi:MAG: hypothetical protein GY820_30195 [Gammaproteobacteria bacterium]|nr:hypothetical protein [Gammaproteobacteria bacterium]
MNPTNKLLKCLLITGLLSLTLPACNNPQQNKPAATQTWPQEEILQQLSEQKQEINALKKDMTFVDSNAKVGYLS